MSMTHTQFTADDVAHMRAALALAARGLGRCWPNPAVGCVIVNDGRVVGRGWTQPGGRPHAETVALAQAGATAEGATAYVTLEPCSHVGKTPPCADALVAAGIKRVVVAIGDPDPRVSGRGIARLRDAGITVDVGLLEEEARLVTEGFLRRVTEGRPMVTLKLATTLDGRIATKAHESQWITGPVARSWGHGLRAIHDAIMVGIGTALADDPELTCRLPGLEDRSPIRVVVDRRLRLPLTSRLVCDARRVPVWVATLAGGDATRRRAYQECGVEIIEIPADADGVMPLAEVLAALGGRGLTRVLVEGGAQLAASLFKEDLVDRLEWYRAAKVIGGDGLAAAQGFGLEQLDAAPRFSLVDMRPAGDDQAESYRRIG
ncbi:bifunctional diaminohydroxyphosphoribosylaminopyrimidine deaminase/5-amino-6-(5-phosphoribosylamino)uracil reductase RibD [Nitrospirillum sp. BR 11163]|uniref:bifunctional diaminohydroxyphosphoribosylaminopyrimidine deaminase/5-amino-6-(5-phosphoribosylamino)uracil reductase RibD n=1 Tax=Nitrospirillum sp. BR 11163 TaxID=3104323 RepID=UPI002AFFB31E|nr:bifunctional diaminohydroxyphosphoribosylaminopyrimidine deaminase/5-amino-6-(5-phosphoribosylamino)uracil reductase RibD [Nitrospirillum sp. BR 11163]MEA1676316.1 bifunctional diaminohydroxyphosphoribosylaminopyrimidine deaminase/5-amino-6-(5-phosphoribosylamino)uracil reductase RibD [Nitrospirillum sp. BR 11163]